MRQRPGQVAIAFLFLFPVLWFTLLLPFSYAWAAAARAVVHSAADAAALGCASQATITSQVDARGEVYGHKAAVDPTRGPQAAAAWWQRSMVQAGFPGLYLAHWSVSVSGAVCVVQVADNLTPPAGFLFADFDFLSAGSAAKALVPRAAVVDV